MRITSSMRKPHRQSKLPVTAALDPLTGLTVLTMLSWSCLVKRFTNSCSFSASSHSSKAPAGQQPNRVQLKLSGDTLIVALRCAVYLSLMPQQHLCPIPIWHPQLQPPSAHQLCRVPRWGLWGGRCRSTEIPANTYRRGSRHRAAGFHLHRSTPKTVTRVLRHRRDLFSFNQNLSSRMRNNGVINRDELVYHLFSLLWIWVGLRNVTV